LQRPRDCAPREEPTPGFCGILRPRPRRLILSAAGGGRRREQVDPPGSARAHGRPWAALDYRWSVGMSPSEGLVTGRGGTSRARVCNVKPDGPVADRPRGPETYRHDVVSW
jgi:hypothetical protein